MSLAAVGVGSLLCADFDVVETGNLNRQPLYAEDDVGMPKVDAAVRRPRGINRHVEVAGRSVKVSSIEDVLSLMDTDLFILCADLPYPEIELWTNDAALLTGTPWIISQYAGPQTLTSLFVPYRTPCFRCADEAHPWILDPDGNGRQRMRTPPGHAVIAPTAIVSGQFAALEEICHLTGMPTQTARRTFRQSPLVYDHNFYTDLEFWPECPGRGGR